LRVHFADHVVLAVIGIDIGGKKHVLGLREDATENAAASLREGLDETLTVMRLDLPVSLERMLSSTNLIEKLFSRVREMAHRVRHWQGGTMILRWSAAGMLEAERGFRKIAGYRSLTKLEAALRAHDAALDRGVDKPPK
jgi:putative transposase